MMMVAAADGQKRKSSETCGDSEPNLDKEKKSKTSVCDGK